MLQPIYDADGVVTAWIEEDDGVVYNLDGVPMVFVREGSVYAYTGAHLGWLDRGLFWDHDGYAVAFLRDAMGGPAKPIKQLAPLRPVRQVKPVRPVCEVAPTRPIHRIVWSDLEWEKFIDGDE